MKKIFKYIVLGLMVTVAISCTDQLRYDEREISHEVDYFTYSRYPLTTAITTVAKNYGKMVKEEKYGFSMLYFWDCYSPERIASFYVTESDWNMEENPYTGVLRTINAVSELAANEENDAVGAVADVLKCVVGGYLTEKYGDIPFSEAIKGREGITSPKFDSQKEVYESIFAMLKSAASTLSSTSSVISSEHDVLFAGDKSKWLKFANSLRFRLMVHSYDAFKKAGTDLSSEMQSIVSGGNYLTSNEDNASLAFPGSEEGDSWYLQTFWGTGNDFTEQKPTKYLIDQMVSLGDPRMYVIFAPALSPLTAAGPDTTYQSVKINGYTYNIGYYPVDKITAGRDVVAGRNLDGTSLDVPYPLDAMWFGNPNPVSAETHYDAVSLPGTNSLYDNRRLTGFSELIATTNGEQLKAVVMEASEMALHLAEARARGWITSGTTSEYYNNGIKLSFDRWGVVDGTKPATYIDSDNIVDDYDAYCASVALDGSAADLDKIAMQKWLAFLVTNQAEAFTDYRRTGKPEFIKTIAESFSTFAFPYRDMYPENEANNNADNYDAAVSGLGSDVPTAKMWILK
jgi:hypothetical protein